jgi:carboxyl-terminal processing protease
VRVTQFQEHTPDKLVAALDAMWKQNNGQMKGLILDLRNDPGGLLNAAVAVSAAFLQQNALGRLHRRAHRRLEDASVCFRRILFARHQGRLYEAPAGVGQAGADGGAGERRLGSRIGDRGRRAAGSQARDHHGHADLRQGLGPDHPAAGNNTAIKLTTARYYTPNGRSIQAKGIQPDIQVEEATIAEADQGLRMREADLERHLSTRPKKARAAPTRRNPSSRAAKEGAPDLKADKPEPAEFGSKGDYQMNQALNCLKVCRSSASAELASSRTKNRRCLPAVFFAVILALTNVWCA